MSTGQPPEPTSTRSSTRVPVQAEVLLEFEKFSGFLNEVSANLSLGGMFVRTRYLKPIGTIVHFEFRLRDDFPLIKGMGEVAWTRWQEHGPRKPAGMGIRFLDLDDQSRDLVTRIVAEHLKQGGALFDLDRGRAEAAAPETRAHSSFTFSPPPLPEREVADLLEPLELAALAAPAPAAAAPPPPAAVRPFVAAAAPPVSRPGAAAIEKPPATKGTARGRDRRRAGLAIAVVLAGGAGAYLGWSRLRRDDGGAATAGAAPVARPAPAPVAAAPPVAPVPAPSQPVPGEPVPARPFSGLERITWEVDGAETRLVLWADGAIAPDAYRRERLDGAAPREVVKLRGVRRPFAPGRLAVGTPQVRQVRTGLHATAAGQELHVVIDLADRGARLLEVSVEPARLVLRVGPG